MLSDKTDLAFLHVHMEVPGRDFTINIDSMSEVQYWLQWKRLLGGRDLLKFSFGLYESASPNYWLTWRYWGYVLRPVIIHFSFAVGVMFSCHFDYALYIYYWKEENICSGSNRVTYFKTFPCGDIHVSININWEKGQLFFWYMVFVYHGSLSKGHSVSK